MTKEELKQAAEERTKQYMNEHTEKYNCESTKLETDNYNAGLEQGYEEGFQDGAEPREKRIAELEAEVKEWKDKADLWCKTANLKDHNIMINKELEKENADLKEEINKIAFARGNLEEENAELKEKVNILDNCDRLGDVITEAYKEQLTKAKNLLQNVADVCGCPNYDIPIELYADIEHFISEVEKC